MVTQSGKTWAPTVWTERAGSATRELIADESGELITAVGSPGDHRRRVRRAGVG
jgi:hypothetical protein